MGLAAVAVVPGLALLCHVVNPPTACCILLTCVVCVHPLSSMQVTEVDEEKARLMLSNKRIAADERMGSFKVGRVQPICFRWLGFRVLGAARVAAHLGAHVAEMQRWGDKCAPPHPPTQLSTTSLPLPSLPPRWATWLRALWCLSSPTARLWTLAAPAACSTSARSPTTASPTWRRCCPRATASR